MATVSRFAAVGSILIALAALSAAAQTGNLSVGNVTFSGDRVTVPIALSSEGEGVSALDFRLRYDPSVFETVDVAAGADASATGKQVLGNSIAPGDYKVLMFGLNQETIAAGEVATVTLRVRETPGSGNADLQLADVTLSLPNATDIPASGGTFPVSFPGGPTEGQGEEPEETPPDDEEPETPETPDGPAPAPDTPGAPAGGGQPGAAPIADAPPGPRPTTPRSDDSASVASRPMSADALRRAEKLRARLPQGGVAAPAEGADPGDATAEGETETSAGAQIGTPITAVTATTETETGATAPSNDAGSAEAGDAPAAAQAEAPKFGGRELRARVLAAAAAVCVLTALLALRKVIFP